MSSWPIKKIEKDSKVATDRLVDIQKQKDESARAAYDAPRRSIKMSKRVGLYEGKDPMLS